MSTFTNIIGWIILALSILITFLYCLRIREKAKSEQVTEKSIELQGFLMTISVVLVLTVPLSRFHLLWMIPASFILGLLSVATPLRILWFFSSLYFAFWYIGINNEGRTHYLAGEYDKAIQAFKKQISKNSSSAEAYFNLGLAYGKIGQKDKEIEAYEQAIKLKPNVTSTYFNLGNAYNEVGYKEKAIAAFNDAIKLNSQYIKARYAVCEIYIEVGDRESALKEYEIIKEKDNTLSQGLATLIKAM